MTVYRHTFTVRPYDDTTADPLALPDVISHHLASDRAKQVDRYIETRVRQLLPKWWAWAVLNKRWKVAIWLSGIRVEYLNGPISGSLEDGYSTTVNVKVIRKSPFSILRTIGGK